MKILLTGASGYIGKNLLPVLVAQGHEVVCCVRNAARFLAECKLSDERISVVEIDFLKDTPVPDTLKTIDAAYYLIHSMSDDSDDFAKLEEISALNFVRLIGQTSCRQIIYLGGITNETKLSEHLSSRQKVSDILGSSGVPLTTIKAGIIVGSGSASFQIISDLVEKLPVMIAPRWLNTRSQPVAISNVLEFLSGVLLREDTYDGDWDIGGPEVLTYREMLLRFAEVRGLKRYVYTIPVMTPRLSSYWLYFVTSTTYRLAIHLVNSMKIEVVARDNKLEKMLGIRPLSYKEAVQRAIQEKKEKSGV